MIFALVGCSKEADTGKMKKAVGVNNDLSECDTSEKESETQAVTVSTVKESEETKDTDTTTEALQEKKTTENTITTEKPIVTTPEVSTQNTTETTTQMVTETTTQSVTEAPTKPQFVAYNPKAIAQLANAKVKKSGKELLPEHLDRLLEEGAITKEEYNEYYPYDGCGYYSVFVETNLLEAKTASGRKLGSEDEIASHIAEMLALETGQYVYVEYSRVYKLNGTDFYEFRCYR